jgi:hypothetical protein
MIPKRRLAWRNAMIDYCCVPTFEGGGAMRWAFPEAFVKPN